MRTHRVRLTAVCRRPSTISQRAVLRTRRAAADCSGDLGRRVAPVITCVRERCRCVDREECRAASRDGIATGARRPWDALGGRQLLTKRATLTFAGAAGGLVSASGFSPRSTPASHPTCIESAVLALYSRSIGVAAVVVVIAALALALPTALVTIGADVQAHLRESNHRCISLSMSKRVTLGGCDRAHLRKGLADTVVHGRRRS